MPLNVSGTVTPQQAISSVATDSVKDQLNGQKIGDDQVLYSSGNGVIKGNRFHSIFKKDKNWQTEKQNAKNEVVNWVKSFGLSETQTNELVSHVETRFQQKGELRGRDLKQIAKMAGEKLQPFAEKPFVCPKNATAKGMTKANLWLALNKNQVVAAKGSYQNGWTLVRDPNASLRERVNVPHAIFSMSPMAKKPEVLQQQTLRSMEQLPPVPTHEIKVDSDKFEPWDGATTNSDNTKKHDFQEVGNAEWQPHDPKEHENKPYDNMHDHSANISYEEYVKSTQIQRPPLNLHVGQGLGDDDLLEILDEELGDDVSKLEIDQEFLMGLRYLIEEDNSEVEFDYTGQLFNDNSGYVNPRQSFSSPDIMDD